MTAFYVSILGAFMFQYIEEPERIRESSIVSKRRDAVMQLWNITDRLTNENCDNI